MEYEKLRTIVFTITTAMLFFIWSLLSDFIKTNLFWGVSLSGIISLGTYRFILKLAEMIMVKCKFVKKLVFGNKYLEGIWVGVYIAEDDSPRFYYECFEQDFSGLIIRGTCFNEDGTYKGAWTSDNVYINEKTGTITYTYVTDMINNTVKNQGLATFSFQRENKQTITNKMIGFSADIFSGKKIKSFEWKLNDKESQMSDSDKIDKAKQYYYDNKSIIAKY